MLVGKASFLVAALVAFAIAIAGLVASYLTRTPRRALEIGSGTTFLALTGVTLLAGQAFLQRWALPLSIAGILLVTLVTAQSGKSFVHEYAAANQPPAVVNSDVFGQITSRLTWIWVGVFAGMTVSSSIPPIVAANASVLDTTMPLTYIGYWVVPFSLLGLGTLATRFLPDWMTAAAGDIVRKTTFVAYHEATIDETVLPGPGTCQSRGRRGRGSVRRQSRQYGNAAGRRRHPALVAVHLQGAPDTALARRPAPSRPASRPGGCPLRGHHRQNHRPRGSTPGTGCNPGR